MTFDGRELRDALGRFATGVCIITTVDKDGRALGLTANSFASVSLDPALVLWSLQNNSDAHDSFASPQYFSINILDQNQLELSNQYAQKGGHLMSPEHFTLGEYGTPILHEALATFECELHATHDGGDHLIIVGRVRDMRCRGDGDPLLFYGGGYRELK